MTCRKVYCKECAYCYRIIDNYIHTNDDDYFCSNTEVQIITPHETKGNAIFSPKKDEDRDALCIHINKNNNCKGYLKLVEEKLPLKCLGITTGYYTKTNKLIEDIDRSH